jgi:hypothetical protein
MARELLGAHQRPLTSWVFPRAGFAIGHPDDQSD